MAIKKLVEVWDGKNIITDNITFLKKMTKEVHLPITSTDQSILNDLLDTYKQIPCAGIAANQIGYNKRIFIGLKIDEYDDGEKENTKKEKVKGNPNSGNYEFYINPKIDQTYKKSIQEEEEGCLSIPEIRLIAERYDKIKVRYYDINGIKKRKHIKEFKILNLPIILFLSMTFQMMLHGLNPLPSIHLCVSLCTTEPVYQMVL